MVYRGIVADLKKLRTVAKGANYLNVRPIGLPGNKGAAGAPPKTPPAGKGKAGPAAK